MSKKEEKRGGLGFNEAFEIGKATIDLKSKADDAGISVSISDLAKGGATVIDLKNQGDKATADVKSFFDWKKEKREAFKEEKGKEKDDGNSFFGFFGGELKVKEKDSLQPWETPEFEAEADKLAYFVTDKPMNVIDGITSFEYNVAKGVLGGAVLFVFAPWVLAVEEASKPDAGISAGFYGFGEGVIRGCVALPVLTLSGLYYGGASFVNGIVFAPDAPGQGHGFMGQFKHIIYTKFTDIAQNKAPEVGPNSKNDFEAELDDLIHAGAIPPKKFDNTGQEIPYTYQFFLTDEPQDMIDGFGGLQYNAAKGFLAGATLMVGAPIVDACDGFEKPLLIEVDDIDEEGNVRTDKDGNPLKKFAYGSAGVEGAIEGFGEGLGRGIAGGMALFGAGLYYSGVQALKGLATLENIPVIDRMDDKISNDVHKLFHEPINLLLLTKGNGLEKYAYNQKKERDRNQVLAEWEESHEGEDFDHVVAKKDWELKRPGIPFPLHEDDFEDDDAPESN